VHGELMTRRYIHPEGYREAQKMTMAEYRVMMRKRKGWKTNRTKAAAEAMVRPNGGRSLRSVS
jgi:hypothetical protein